MAQTITHIDLNERRGSLSRSMVKDARKVKGTYVSARTCKTCGKAPNLVLQSAEYESNQGRLINKGNYDRVQAYCSSIQCQLTVYTPLEGPNLRAVIRHWNKLQGKTAKFDKTKVELNSDRKDGY